MVAVNDPAHKATDKLLKEYERKIRKEYRQAVKEAQAKLDDYMRRFEIKDEIWKKNVASGKKTADEYKKWRMGQIMGQRRWEMLRDELAVDYHNANVKARSMLDGYRAKTYAENFNFGTFEVELGSKVDTSFTLYSEDAVNRIIKNSPELLPPPGEKLSKRIAAKKDIAWQKGKIQSIMTQAILQGESIPRISKRIAEELGETNHASTVRYARTAITAAENAGRVDSYIRAEEDGIEMEQEWLAIKDMRTRHEHREADGQRRPVGEPFEVGGEELMYPGDPSASGHLIWNCRCTLRGIVAGLEPQSRKYRTYDGIEGMSYEEWKDSKVVRRKKITSQEEIQDYMRRRTIMEDYADRGS